MTILTIARSRGLRSHALSVADQAILSAGTLVFGVLLARALDRASYGEFTLAYALVLFLGGLYNSFIIEPMCILGPSRHEGVPQTYFTALIVFHLGLSACLLSVVGVMLFAAGSMGIVRVAGLSRTTFFLSATVVTSATMLFWLVRRRAYAVFSVTRALRGTSAYVVVLIGGVAILGWAEVLTLSGSLGMLVAASMAGVLVDVGYAPPVVESDRPLSASRNMLWTVLRQHWMYGSWAALASVVYWGSGNLYYYLTGALVGLAGVASLRVVTACFQPVRAVQTGLTNALLPTLAATRRVDEWGVAFRRQILSASGFFVALTVIYAVAFTLFGGWVLRALYGARYDDAAAYVPILAIGAIIDSVGEPAALGLKALEEPKLICVGYAVGAAVTLLVGIPAIGSFGVLGAAYASVGSSAACAASFWLMYLSRARRSMAPPVARALRQRAQSDAVDF